MAWFGVVLALLAAAGGALYLLRLRDAAAGDRLTDDMIEQIERRGSVDVDEPLDLDDIADEEARFWDEERWDDADEF